MLAQNFLAADALRITAEQREALIRTLGALERGEVTRDTFDMSCWRSDMAACLGGWAEILSGRDLFSPGSEGELPPQQLGALFSGGMSCSWPPEAPGRHSTDPAQGAAALRNYLTTGDSRWDEVVQQ